jgi:putative flavoprotein involved in K+ transport
VPRTDTIVIGAGQAGLAVSRCLRDAGRDHVVLERGRLGESWRSQRWDSLRLLSPNWMTNLPGWPNRGPDPDGFMSAADLVSELEGYARASDTPVREQTTVEHVRRSEDGFVVGTDQGSWRGEHVVVATGHCMVPAVPSAGTMLSPRLHQLTADRYRNPEQLPDGGVLVVGASATGAQLAEELAGAGRDVVLAVGAYSRVPRRYRGRDIFTWFERLGILDEPVDRRRDPRQAATVPSFQLIGSSVPRNIDLITCQAAGVQLAGRLVDVDGTTAHFAIDIDSTIDDADARMHRVLDRIDQHIDDHDLVATVGEPSRPARPVVGPTPERIDLAGRGITTVLWATGYRRRYPWLPADALDERGEIRHRDGVGAMDGLYVVGLRFQRHRSSNFLHGVGRDARFVVDHLTGAIDRSRSIDEVAA